MGFTALLLLCFGMDRAGEGTGASRKADKMRIGKANF